MTIAPLAGRRVLDLGALCAQRPHGIAASMAAKLARQYGATVVRPLPPAGEPLARLAPMLPDGSSALDRFLNEGKASAGDGGYDAAIGDAGTLATYASAVPVQVCLSAFTPDNDPPVTELGLLALTGLLGIVGEAEGPPARLAGHQVAYAAGLAACTGMLAALRAGGAEVVDVSLFDVTCWLNWKVAAGVLVLGAAPARGGDRTDWYTVPAGDGHVALVYQEKDWPALRDMVGDARLREERFQTRKGRRTHRADFLAALLPWFTARTRAEVTAAAQAVRIPIGPVKTPSELLQDRQHQARGFLRADGAPVLPIGWDGQRLEAAHG